VPRIGAFARLAVCAGVIGLCIFSVPVRAIDSTATTGPIALVVDVQRVLDESEAAKSVQKQLSSHRTKFQSETEKEENQLRKAEQSLDKAHAKLTADAYTEREQKLRQQILTVERQVSVRRKYLDQSFTEGMNVVHDKFLAIVQIVAREKNANLVLVKQQILWSDKALDVTDEVLARLNKALPQVMVKMPQEDKDAE
jgi:Skp family chaperone for outer membrane proteins